MSEDSTPGHISDLAEKVKERHARDQERIEAILNSYERDLKDISKTSLTQLESDMENLRITIFNRVYQNLTRLAAMWAIALTAIVIALISLGWTIWDANTITTQHAQIQRLRQKNRALTNIQTHKCGQQMCVKIQPGQKYGPNKDYRIIQPKPQK